MFLCGIFQQSTLRCFRGKRNWLQELRLMELIHGHAALVFSEVSFAGKPPFLALMWLLIIALLSMFWGGTGCRCLVLWKWACCKCTDAYMCCMVLNDALSFYPLQLPIQPKCCLCRGIAWQEQSSEGKGIAHQHAQHCPPQGAWLHALAAQCPQSQELGMVLLSACVGSWSVPAGWEVTACALESMGNTTVIHPINFISLGAGQCSAVPEPERALLP